MADLVNKPYQTLMSELSGQPGHKLGADLVLPLIQVTGGDEAVRFLARELGGFFIRLPTPGAGAPELMSGLADSIRECSEFFSEVARDVADGDIPRDQLDRIPDWARNRISNDAGANVPRPQRQHSRGGS